MTLTPALSALAWALIHSLWEVALIAAAVAGLARQSRRARVRHLLYYAGVVASLAALAVTFVTVFVFAGAGAGAGAFAAGAGAGGSPAIDRALALVLIAWSAGASWGTARTLVGLWGIARLRRASAPLVGRWSDRLASLAAALGVRRPVGLAESRRIDTPMVVGALRPLILLPLGLIARASPATIEAALLHELVHIRRHDYLLGVIQALCEAIFFYHPALRWLARQAREEREQSCDDAVAGHTGDPLRYALALAELEGFRAAIRPLSPPAALGQMAAGGPLMARIRRLVDPPSNPPRRPLRGAWWLAPSLTLASALALAGLVAPACIGEVAPEAAPLSADVDVDADADVAPAAEPVAGAPAAEEGGAAAEVGIAWLPPRVRALSPAIRAASTRHGVDPELVAIVALLESGGDPGARSPTGARGLMQLMPATADTIAAARGLAEHDVARLDDPEYNLDLGAYHLAELVEDFAGEGAKGRPLRADEVALVAAAYNGGARQVRAYMAGEAALSGETERYQELARGLWEERDAARSEVLAGLGR